MWLTTAIDPVSQRDWLLENLLVFVCLVIIARIHRTTPLSNFSYFSMTFFFTLHAIGAHYTYTEVPLGHWLREMFHWNRNHYDRIIHFLFGLLFARPFRELFLRTLNQPDLERSGWSYWSPLSSIMTFSIVLEMVEATVADFVSPELGAAYVGAQGDPWDAQKDMSLALLGSCLSLLVIFISKKLHLLARSSSAKISSNH